MKKIDTEKFLVGHKLMLLSTANSTNSSKGVSVDKTTLQWIIDQIKHRCFLEAAKGKTSLTFPSELIPGCLLPEVKSTIESLWSFDTGSRCMKSVSVKYVIFENLDVMVQWCYRR